MSIPLLRLCGTHLGKSCKGEEWPRTLCLGQSTHLVHEGLLLFPTASHRYAASRGAPRPHSLLFIWSLTTLKPPHHRGISQVQLLASPMHAEGTLLIQWHAAGLGLHRNTVGLLCPRRQENQNSPTGIICNKRLRLWVGDNDTPVPADPAC